ncbi:HdeD family acid-resistance protein [Fructilactobacillus fructivorans]|uniref:Integral membrane protein n=1 Tax=Fructilactobacillus fructivorans TaxID=1614 RepID=A0A0C1Q352_9LACO|nr:DUF308 domain-containing protein [Fructilactobacillus fructivorans]KID42248.1 Integral membrane protein [Fructilactobacillus fructivorans]MCT0151126.1 DUF308 domain-containing protein [Fructilactobacillus fructivorans]MCT2867316.1 DUF308 domain-containing protein [Fructilactobacillus fructivorans]MCT2869164.1 DUF308 domain-containing protein [Fructilactobacillus fructivorans]MCT2873115.1 DUF308 domain-containing protein [Fructilactobacillus fructivorans]
MFSKTKGFDPFSLVIGILSVILSLFILRNPLNSFKALVFVIAILSIVEGIFKIAEISQLDRSLGMSPVWLIINGVLDIIIGILIFLDPAVGGIYIWLMLSIWFIIDSLFELWYSRFAERNHKGYFWFEVILGIVGLILGIALLFQPAMAMSVALFLVAFYFMFFGILLIVRSF